MNTQNAEKRPASGSFLTGLVLAAVVGACVYCSGRDFLEQFKTEPIYKGPGITDVKMLSDYNPELKGTNGDTAIYVLDSGKPGASFLIMGGTHPTEPAGLLAAVIIVENAIPTEGRLFVIPHANNSGFSTCEPGLGHIPYFHLKTSSGNTRYFRYGNRGSNPVDQFPDPDMYLHYPSGQSLAADEIRNLDRAHPGNPHGLLTQQIAWGLNRLCWEENVDMVIDHHEAPPEKPLVNAICVHQKGIDLTSMMAMDLEEQGIRMRVEISPIPLHGFTHREFGDYTPAIAFLSETPNPSQGSARGAVTESLIIEGCDPIYEQLLDKKLLKVDYKKGGVTLNERTARNVATDVALANHYTEMYPDVKNKYVPEHFKQEAAKQTSDPAQIAKIAEDLTQEQEARTTSDPKRAIVITNLPTYDEILENGVGHYLRDADYVPGTAEKEATQGTAPAETGEVVVSSDEPAVLSDDSASPDTSL